VILDISGIARVNLHPIHSYMYVSASTLLVSCLLIISLAYLGVNSHPALFTTLPQTVLNKQASTGTYYVITTFISFMHPPVQSLSLELHPVRKL
jgi:hypothetical protein